MLFLTLLVMGAVSFIAVSLRETRRERRAQKTFERERTALVMPLVPALKKAGILWTHDPLSLEFDHSGIARSTPLVNAARDALGLRFAAPFGLRIDHDSGPTGWGDWHEVRMTFMPTACPKCRSLQMTLYGFTSYQDLVGKRGGCAQSTSYGPYAIADVCLGCHAMRGTENMVPGDVDFVHRCREIAKRTAAEKSLAEGPYR